MLYYRSSINPREISVSSARMLSLASMASYPAGALILSGGPDTAASVVGGYGLILFALLCCAPLLNSSLQRVVGEEVKILDEFELRLRGRAMSAAYAVFTGVALLLIMYTAVASDKGMWAPRTYAQFNGIFWGIFLYAILLPVTALSWMVDSSFAGESE